MADESVVSEMIGGYNETITVDAVRDKCVAATDAMRRRHQ